MKPLTRHSGIVIPLDRTNVDTDQIIPKQFLKRIERTGYGDFLFYNWRFRADGTEEKSFILNSDHHRHGTVLLARRNFGCGSSREHAAWALQDFGIRVVIAPSFADIFDSNASKNGLLTLALKEDEVDRLFQAAASHPGYAVTIDLDKQVVQDEGGLQFMFNVDPFRRKCLMQGLDDIALTLAHEAEIANYETSHNIF